MCGISGVFAERITDSHENIVAAIVNSQFDRGPDYQSIQKICGHLTQALLGHNRLSIIDLTSTSNQPMWDASKRYCITYNGEIYNYIELRDELKKLGCTFLTNGDTEVILNAFSVWGIESLERFCGPFAFGLFDTQTDTLWLCRDRFGVRPLYYVMKNETIYFASSTSVLASALHLKANLLYLAQGLNHLVFDDDSEMSPYQNISSLPPATVLKISMTSSKQLICKKNKYYDLTEASERLVHNLPMDNVNDLIQRVNHAFQESVTIRLRSDVPLGISLSGGLDSSAVAAQVAEKHSKTIGFSFGHPNVKKTEGPLVAQSAKFLGIEVNYVWPTAQEMIEGLFQTLDAQDAPFSSLSVVAQFLLYRRVRSSGIKVLLGGQGGDESFMGYKKFLLFWFQQLYKQKKYMHSAINLIQLLPMFFSEIKSIGAYWQHRHRYFGQANYSRNNLNLPLAPLNLKSSHQNLAHRQIKDITQFSLPTLLRYEDRNAMANSIESRMPFLDHRLIELGVALPTAIKLRSGFSKWPLRQIMHQRIPNSIRLARYKRGFDISLEKLLKSGLGVTIRSVLHEKTNLIKDLLRDNTSIQDLYSDEQLVKRPGAMTEAIALLWLTRKEGTL